MFNSEEMWHPHLKRNWLNEKDYEIIDKRKATYPAFLQIGSTENNFLSQQDYNGKKMQCGCKFIKINTLNNSSNKNFRADNSNNNNSEFKKIVNNYVKAENENESKLRNNNTKNSFNNNNYRSKEQVRVSDKVDPVLSFIMKSANEFRLKEKENDKVDFKNEDITKERSIVNRDNYLNKSFSQINNSNKGFNNEKKLKLPQHMIKPNFNSFNNNSEKDPNSLVEPRIDLLNNIKNDNNSLNINNINTPFYNNNRNDNFNLFDNNNNDNINNKNPINLNMTQNILNYLRYNALLMKNLEGYLLGSQYNGNINDLNRNINTNAIKPNNFINPNMQMNPYLFSYDKNYFPPNINSILPSRINDNEYLTQPGLNNLNNNLNNMYYPQQPIF